MVLLGFLYFIVMTDDNAETTYDKYISSSETFVCMEEIKNMHNERNDRRLRTTSDNKA